MLEEPPILQVKRQWDRLPQELLQRFEGTQTGHLVDAMSGRGGLEHAIKPQVAGADRFIGSALPVSTGPNDNLALIAGVAVAQPSDVVVVAADAFDRTAVCGDIVAQLAKNAGAVAIVIDGFARDLAGLEGVSLPIFARGITPNSCVKSGPGTVGLPVVAGGVSIAAGDLVVGDRDGVVIVPGPRVREVADQVDAIREAETALIERVEGGLKTFDWMSELLDSDRVRFVD